MNSTTNKEKWWIYLIFLFVGIISLFTGLLIGENPLFDGGLLVMLLPLSICSILLHLVIKYYSTEKYSFTFVFVTLVASIIIFLIGYIVPLGSFFLHLILFAIGSIIFKNDRHKKDTEMTTFLRRLFGMLRIPRPYRERITADEREINDFPKLPSATSFIRETLGEMQKW
jgi:hypothetical protein